MKNDAFAEQKRLFLVLLVGLIGFLLPWTVGRFFNLLDFELVVVVPIIPLVASIVSGIGFATAMGIAFYLHLYYMIEGRASMVEAILPDFLLLVASSISAGMTPFSAFRSSIRKEFGPLSEEIKIAASKSLGTESFQQALKELSKRIKSRALEETVAFFSQALKGGGHLAKLLENTANDLRQTQEMKKELLSSTRMYVIFVAFVVVIGTPLLLAIAVQFLDMVAMIQSEVPGGAGEIAAVAFLSTELSITPEFMQTMAYILLFGNAVLSSIFIGVLSAGKTKIGLKYAPVILVVSLVTFTASKALLGGFLGGA